MENTVVETQVDVGNEYEAADLQAEDVQEPVETQEVDAPKQPDPLPQNAQEAFGKEMQRIRQAERARYEQHPYYQAGMRLLNDLMRRQGVSIEEASKLAEENYIKAIAEREGVSEYVVRSMLMQQPTQNNAPDVSNRADEIRRDIAQMNMPDGFDFNEAIKDEDFAQMLLDYPTNAAIQMYHMKKQLEQANQKAAQAPQQVAEQLRARQAIPQPMKPQQPVTPKTDFSTMTDEQFFAWERANRK